MKPTSPPVSGGRSGQPLGVQRLERAAQRRPAGRRRSAGPTGGVPVQHRLAVALGEHRRRPDADERPPRPDPAVLGRLEQERAGPVLRQLAVEPDRRLAVGEQPPGDRHHPAGLGQRAERLEVGADRAGRQVAVTTSPRRPAAPTTAGSGVTSKQDVRPGVAGRALLDDPHQQRVAVAVEADRAHPLAVAGGLALDPVGLAAAAPVRGPAGGQGAVQRLVVHPAEHEHPSVAVVLHDRGHQAGGVTGEPGGDGGVEGARAGGLGSWRPLSCAARVGARAGPDRKRTTSAASSSSACSTAAGRGANGASSTPVFDHVHVATARPSTSANGRNRPLTVTTEVCSPRIGSRLTQPCSSGSNAPSSRGGGSTASAGSAAERGSRPRGRPARRGAGRAARRWRRSPRRTLALRQTGPLGQVPLGRRPVAAQVAHRQLGQRGLAVEPGRRRARASRAPARTPARVPTIGPRTTRPRSVAQQQQVDHRLALDPDPGRGDALAQLGPGQRPVALERALDRGHRALGVRRRHALLIEPPGVGAHHGRCGERVQPPVVVGVDEVQGAAVEPRHHQRPLVAHGVVDVGGAQCRGTARARPAGLRAGPEPVRRAAARTTSADRAQPAYRRAAARAVARRGHRRVGGVRHPAACLRSRRGLLRCRRTRMPLRPAAPGWPRRPDVVRRLDGAGPGRAPRAARVATRCLGGRRRAPAVAGYTERVRHRHRGPAVGTARSRRARRAAGVVADAGPGGRASWSTRWSSSSTTRTCAGPSRAGRPRPLGAFDPDDAVAHPASWAAHGSTGAARSGSSCARPDGPRHTARRARGIRSRSPSRGARRAGPARLRPGLPTRASRSTVTRSTSPRSAASWASETD